MGNASLQAVSPSKTPLAMGNARSLQTVSPSKSATSFVAPIGEQISPSKTPGISVPMIVLPIRDDHLMQGGSPLLYTNEDDESSDQPENFARISADEIFEKSKRIKAGKTLGCLKSMFLSMLRRLLGWATNFGFLGRVFTLFIYLFI